MDLLHVPCILRPAAALPPSVQPCQLQQSQHDVVGGRNPAARAGGRSPAARDLSCGEGRRPVSCGEGSGGRSPAARAGAGLLRRGPEAGLLRRGPEAGLSGEGRRPVSCSEGRRPVSCSEGGGRSLLSAAAYDSLCPPDNQPDVPWSWEQQSDPGSLWTAAHWQHLDTQRLTGRGNSRKRIWSLFQYQLWQTQPQVASQFLTFPSVLWDSKKFGLLTENIQININNNLLYPNKRNIDFMPNTHRVHSLAHVDPSWSGSCRRKKHLIPLIERQTDRESRT